MRSSLDSIRYGSGGLNQHRQAMLDRVPGHGDWASFQREHIEMKDLAYLSAKTGDEFAILRGRTEDILFHGTPMSCSFDDVLSNMLRNKQLIIFGHSHPGEEQPIPSPEDMTTLKEIGQSTSKLISGMTGQEVTYSADPFGNIVL